MKLGLVLAGGGGKGAYHIGVWKHLREIGLDKEIVAFSGTSVGALNACLLMQGDLKLAEHIWKNELENSILSTSEENMKNIAKSIMTLHKESITTGKAMMSAAIMLLSQGVFSREGLLNMLKKNLDLEKLSKDVRLLFATCFSLSKFEPMYFLLNNTPLKDWKKVLCATSAIPVIFKSEVIDDDEYIDGGIPGFGDNVPINPLYSIGCDTIIVVHFEEDTAIDKNEYPNANIIEIRPRIGLGGIISGVLDFSQSGAKARIDLGYIDAKRVLDEGFLQTFF